MYVMFTDIHIEIIPGDSTGWRIIKFHIITHMIHHILMYGWIENSSCQAGEHCHRWFLKLIKHLTNNKVDWEKQLFNIHTREETLQSILAAVSKYI